MTLLPTAVDTWSSVAAENRKAMSALVDELHEKLAKTREGGPQRRGRQEAVPERP